MKLDKRAIKIQTELSDRILKLTDNGEEMVQFYLGLLRDDKVALKYRMEAAKWLSDRSWGKEPTVLHVNGGGLLDGLLQATDAELLSIAAGIAQIPAGTQIDFNLDSSKVIGKMLPERLPTNSEDEEDEEEYGEYEESYEDDEDENDFDDNMEDDD